MGIGNISRTDSVNILDIVSKTVRKNRSHGRRKNRNQRKFRTNHTNISDLISISKNNGRHYLLTKLCSLPINKLNKILEDCNTISYYSPKYEIVQIIMAYCYSKLFPKIDRPEDHKKHFIKIKYVNKGFDFVNIAGIFNDHSVKEQIPGYFDNTELPLICYIYKKSTRKFVFNYSQLCKDVNISENTPTSCNCSNSEYIYGPISHVITGDLNIVQDRELKSFLSKGPKYRPPSIINWNECRNIIHDSLHTYCMKWIKREKADKKSLDSFFNSVMKIVDIRIQHFKEHFTINNNHKKPISRIKHKLKELAKKFVFVPADKAANNIIIV